jgi:hypothetical protein
MVTRPTQDRLEARVMLLRLRCECSRNLADVTERETSPAGVVDHLWVTPRPNVQSTPDYRPDTSLVSGRTYSFACRCGRKHVVRHDRISAHWRTFALSDRRVAYATLGRDL